MLSSEWYRIKFNDKSHFTLEADDHRLFVWRGRNLRSQLAFDFQKHTAITPARRYVDTIPWPVVSPSMACHLRVSFQQDNTRPHTARISLDCLRAVNTHPWSGRSLDLSPIEHVWNKVGHPKISQIWSNYW
ncbi:transposable element Tcb1 transposase [Trichonephila clavipes]|nr:transposable element Tcb1 transposase [Trichonephila clavipes]